MGRVEWSVQERALPGLTFPLLHADDADAGTNGVRIYELATPPKIFDMQAINQTNGTLDVALVLRGRLDFETQDFNFLQTGVERMGWRQAISTRYHDNWHCRHQ